MHRCLLIFLFVVFMNAASAFSGRCEIVRFVDDENLSKKCCVLNKTPDEKTVERFKKQGYLVLQYDRITSVCRNLEEGEAEIASRSGEDDTEKKNIPNIDVHQIIDSTKRCPDDEVLDFQGNCVDPFK